MLLLGKLLLKCFCLIKSLHKQSRIVGNGFNPIDDFFSVVKGKGSYVSVPTQNIIFNRMVIVLLEVPNFPNFSSISSPKILTN